MTDPNSAIPETAKPRIWRRYEQWRGRRHEQFMARHAHKFARLRNQRGFHRTCVALMSALLVTLAGAVTAFFSQWFFIPWLFGVGLTVALLAVLRVITGSVGDAPPSALDEIQLAKRNSARSIGYLVVFSLMFIPYIVLIFFGSKDDLVDGHTVYATAILLVTLLLTGGSTPVVLTAWWLADPDPEDFIDPPAAVAESPTQIREAEPSRPSD
ncbi:hypothetical protein [Williamsia sterculiae]|nr:hypothetical protein [Williamsia sterculiae]